MGAFGTAILVAGRAIRFEKLPTSHIWYYDLVGAIVNHPVRTDLASTMNRFDSIDFEWEKVVWQVSGAPADAGIQGVRFFSPFIDRGMRRIHRRGPTIRVPFQYVLFSLCTGMTAASAGQFSHFYKLEPIGVHDHAGCHNCRPC